MNAPARIIAPSTDTATFVLVEATYGADPVFPETSRFYTEADCVREIIEGQFDNPSRPHESNIIRVLAICPDEGTCRDITEDVSRLIASIHPERMSREALNLCARYGYLTFDLDREVA